MRIAHISDLHLESAWFQPEWAENLLRLLEGLQPDLVIATGDLTDDGYWHEYRAVEAYFDRIAAPVKLAVPGNHDARNEGYLIFEELFGTRTPFYENGTFVILGLDSSQPDLEEGHVGRENYPRIREAFSGREGKLKLLALHHPGSRNGAGAGHPDRRRRPHEAGRRAWGRHGPLGPQAQGVALAGQRHLLHHRRDGHHPPAQGEGPPLLQPL